MAIIGKSKGCVLIQNRSFYNRKGRSKTGKGCLKKPQCVNWHPKNCVKWHAQNWNASKITPKKCVNWHGKNDLRQKSPQKSASIDMEKIICVKNHPASQFCASKITLRQFSTRQRPRVKGHAPKSKSQNSRVTVPCVKHSVRHKTSTLLFSMLILGQKGCFLGPTISEIP